MSAVLVALILVAAFWIVCFILALFMSGGDFGDALIAATGVTFSIVAILGVVFLAGWLIGLATP